MPYENCFIIVLRTYFIILMLSIRILLFLMGFNNLKINMKIINIKNKIIKVQFKIH